MKKEKEDPDFLEYLRRHIEVYKDSLNRINDRLRTLRLELENFEHRWVDHPERELIIDANTEEIEALESLANILEIRIKEFKTYVKKN